MQKVTKAQRVMYVSGSRSLDKWFFNSPLKSISQFVNMVWVVANQLWDACYILPCLTRCVDSGNQFADALRRLSDSSWERVLSLLQTESLHCPYFWADTWRLLFNRYEALCIYDNFLTCRSIWKFLLNIFIHQNGSKKENTNKWISK